MNEQDGRRGAAIRRGGTVVAAVALLAVALLAAACGDSDDDAETPAADTTDGATETSGAGGEATTMPPADSAADATLEGPVWSLQSAGAITVPDGVSITATFEGGTVSGTAGCNRYTAPYEVDGDALTIGPAAATQIACEPAISAAEQAFLTALGAVDGYAVTDTTLELSTGTGDPLVFDQQAQSVAGSWNVIGYLNADASAFVSLIVDTAITAQFDEAGTVSGSAGCNTYSGGYQTEGTTIAIGPLASTRMLCSEPEGIMDQELGFLAAMEAATTLKLEGADLVLFDDEGRRAVQMQPAG